MIVTLDSQRRLTVPVSVAPASPGDAFEVTFDADEDAFVFRRVTAKGDWLSVMKECPVPMDDLGVGNVSVRAIAVGLSRIPIP